MFEVISLGSGSSGNTLLIRAGQSTLLVDCGVGIRRLAPALHKQGLEIADIDAVLITHEHGDHIRELPRFVGAGATILCTAGSSRATGIPSSSWEVSVPGRPVQLDGVEIVAIAVSHDAAEPCGFLVRTPFGSLSVMTDLGCASPAAAEAIAESQLVVLEANHDEAMLRRGPYPAHLQRRILSDSGHLSNDACGELLVAALHGSRHLPTVWLAHLSETNNRPATAARTVERRLAQAGLRLDLHVLPRRDTGVRWTPESAKRGSSQLALGF